MLAEGTRIEVVIPFQTESGNLVTIPLISPAIRARIIGLILIWNVNILMTRIPLMFEICPKGLKVWFNGDSVN